MAGLRGTRWIWCWKWLEDNIPCRFMALGPRALACPFVEAEFFHGVFLYGTGQTSDEIFGLRRNHIRFAIDTNQKAGLHGTRLNKRELK
jgi:hypothetical protein